MTADAAPLIASSFEVKVLPLRARQAVYRKNHTGDVACHVRGEEYVCVGNVFRFAHATKRNSGNKRINYFFGQGIYHVGVRNARCYCVDANLVSGKLSRE